MKSKFIENVKELINSIISYNSSPEFIRSSLGGFPKYFVHTVINGNHYFGLSKFCAFNDISLLEYTSGVRKKANGHETQKHISKVCYEPWTTYDDSEYIIQKEFDNWINGIFPTYKKHQANFITVTTSTKITINKKKGKVDEKLNRLIGEIGEKIALQY
ncbi:MAG: hypothetical protein Q8R57_12735 [Bacteroidota bacterium]|nr:hypothetical protein [Bacteroidota bacterium]